MKVRLFSDVHLEFGPMDPGEGDVLVLSGDICVAQAFIEEPLGEEALRYLEFFEKCVAGYNKVFYTMGNHEYYNILNWTECESTLRNTLPKGITLLNNQSEFYNGWHFVGAPLWASFDGANEAVMHQCQLGMSDYHVIGKDGQFCIDPIDTLSEHVDTVEWLHKCIPTLKGPVFVFTHHAPSKRSVEGNYRSESLSPAYATDLELFIKANPNIRVWAHGHIHEARNYIVGETNIVSNPRGYVGCETGIGFNPNFTIDLNDYVQESSQNIAA